MIPGFEICAFDASHLDEAENIEKFCFSDPWSRKSLECFVNGPFSAIACVTDDGRLVGYGAYIQSADEGEIANLATHPDYRKRGLGGMMLDSMLDKLKQGGAVNIYLEVRASNKPAASLYLGRGFVPIGIRKKYYSNPTEDAVIMKKS